MVPLRVLIIDDETDIRHVLTLLLKAEGFEVRSVSNGEEGLKELMGGFYDLVLCDVRMPTMGGMELLDELARREIATTVIVMSAFGNRELAVEAIKRGAYDYIDKPFRNDEVIIAVLKAQERLQLKRENEALRAARHEEHGLIGSSQVMQETLRTIDKIAVYKSTVLIQGESGTGKELVARAIHRASPRVEGPWIPVNCGAIPEALLESELFGHAKGAFTDASADKIGLFEEANGGTIFLDEIGEMPRPLQVKLLRVLQEGEIRRIGENRSRTIDVRVVAASLRDLGAAVRDGTFREDLFYRLNVIQMTLPPLRDRKEDIEMLVRHFVELQNRRLGAGVESVSPGVMKVFLKYTWPGNIRELQNCIERGVVMARANVIERENLPPKLLACEDELELIFASDELSIKKMSAKLERLLISRALQETGGNRTRASKLLEISHRALLYKIKDYQLGRVGFNSD
jgi:two-component system, NtrC family, response regulator AtoC